MKNQKVFLGILKSFLHPEQSLPNTKMLTVEDWRLLMDMASAHAVLPVVHEAAWKRQSFQKLPEQEKINYKQASIKMIVMQIQRTKRFLELYPKMREAGVTPLVLKGLVCRNMYQLSDYRVSCDEDLIVRREEFPALDTFFLSEGFQRNVEIEKIEKIQEVSYFHPKTGLYLEVHLSLFSEESDAYGKLNQEFPQIFERHIVQSIQGVEIHTLDETQHMLYLICHGVKHFMHSGFGIRQLCDMLLFAETYGELIDWEEIKRRTKRQNIYIFWMNLFDIGEKYLGFSWKKAKLSKPDRNILDSEELLKDIMESGIYGKASEARLHSANITLEAARQKEDKRSGIMASVFPNLEYMKKKYEYLQTKSFLLPVAWVHRIWEYRRNNDNEAILNTIEKGKERVALLEKYGMIKSK